MDERYEGGQNLRSHQIPLNEAHGERTGHLMPEIGEAAASTPTAESTVVNTEAAISEPLTYWHAKIELNDMQTCLLAADQRFLDFARTNSWGMGGIYRLSSSHC